MTPRMRLLLIAAAGLAAVAAIDYGLRLSADDVARPVSPVARQRPAAIPAQPGEGAAAVPGGGGGIGWLAPPPLDRFSAVFAAPLFDPSRQAAAPAPPPEPPPEATGLTETATVDPLSGARLIGVASGDGRELALVEISGSVARLEVGDAVGDWTLAQIAPAGLVFERGEEARELSMPR